MSKNLKISIIQSELHWENANANRAMFSDKIQNIEGETDLIVLPEMFTTGFSMNAKNLAEENDGETFQWMISEAEKHNCAITGSVIISEENHFYNRLFFFFPTEDFKNMTKNTPSL